MAYIVTEGGKIVVSGRFPIIRGINYGKASAPDPPTPTPDACGLPSGLKVDGFLDTSADVSWDAAQFAQAYQIRYRPVGSPSWINTTSGGTSKELNPLLPSTTYEWEVKAICTPAQDPEESAWVIGPTFTTDISATPVNCTTPVGTYSAIGGGQVRIDISPGI